MIVAEFNGRAIYVLLVDALPHHHDRGVIQVVHTGLERLLKPSHSLRALCVRLTVTDIVRVIKDQEIPTKAGRCAADRNGSKPTHTGVIKVDLCALFR